MDLWIRSQDKSRLAKIINLQIERTTIKGNAEEDNWDIYLGHYKTKKRALEVLDEIQNILKPKYMIRMDGNLNNIENFLNINGAYIKNENNADVKNINNTYVYEMPEE